MDAKTMDNQHTNVENGTASLLVSFVIGFIGWIGGHTTGDIIKYGSMALSGGAAILAGIYWYFAIKDKRLDIKRKQKENK